MQAARATGWQSRKEAGCMNVSSVKDGYYKMREEKEDKTNE